MEFTTNVESMLKQFAMIRKAYAKYICQAFAEENFSPSELDILIFLSNNSSIDTSKELVVCLGISKSLVCRSVEGLVKRGLLSINEDGQDRRVQRLTLTKESSMIIEKCKEQQKWFSKKILEHIKEEELLVTSRVMEQIQEQVTMILKGE